MKKFLKFLFSKVGLIGIGAAGALLAIWISNAPEWEFWDRFIEPEPIDIPVMLSTQLKFDDSGVYTGEIRRALEQADLKYRIINRVFPEQETITTSSERIQNIRNEAKQILNIHGGDVLIYGAVGAKRNIIWIQFFGPAPDGYIETGIEVNLSDDSWRDKITRIVKSMATESGLQQFPGAKRLDGSMSLEEFIDASENKLSELNKIVESDFLKERTELGIEIIQTARAKINGDVITIRKIRNKIEKQIGKKPRMNELYYHKVRRLKLADLYMEEGLMEGNPEKIDEGMKIGIEAGTIMLEEGMREDETAVQRPENAAFPHWLMMTILVLACDDEKMMKHLEKLLLKHCGRVAQQRCMAYSDGLRMLLPLNALNSNPNRIELEAIRSLLAKSRDFGLGMLDHWQDPFFHARKLGTKRLIFMQNAQKPERKGAGTDCPNLERWMEMKGWYQPLAQN